VALDPREPAPRRRRATLALAAGRFSDARPVLEALLDGRAGSEVAEAAIDVLGWFDDASVPAIVLARWKTFGPEARNRALDALLRRRAFVPELLGAIEKGAIEPTALDLPRREKLLRNPDDGIRGRAAKAFPEQSTDRERVVAGYRPSLELAGDPGRGRALFDKNCATCHLARAGRTVGPDLARVQGRSKLELLESILDPSRAIESGFTNYVILTRDGQMHDGLIAGDTGGIVTLRRGNEDETILRSEITEIRASSISLMPDGFEATLGPREIADVIAFLQGTNLREAAARGAR
jgi:putative heme-binding domain-containing protein